MEWRMCWLKSMICYCFSMKLLCKTMHMYLAAIMFVVEDSNPIVADQIRSDHGVS